MNVQTAGVPRRTMSDKGVKNAKYLEFSQLEGWKAKISVCSIGFKSTWLSGPSCTG